MQRVNRPQQQTGPTSVSNQFFLSPSSFLNCEMVLHHMNQCGVRRLTRSALVCPKKDVDNPGGCPHSKGKDRPERRSACTFSVSDMGHGEFFFGRGKDAPPMYALFFVSRDCTCFLKDRV